MRLEQEALALNQGSYYEATGVTAPSHAPLSGDIRTDVCVVGGGIAGLSAALDLAARGYRVVLLEGRRIGWGASGRNGGQALAGYACDQGVFEQQLGLADARRAHAISMEAVNLMRRRIAEHAIHCDWVDGAATVAVTPRKARALKAWSQTMRERYGREDLVDWTAQEAQDHIASRRYHGGVLDPHGGHLHPLNYTLGLARAAVAAGVQMHENSVVGSVHPSPGGDALARVCTAKGKVRATAVLLAGNVHLGAAAPRLAGRIMPVGTYIMATEPMAPERARALIRDRLAVSDTQFVLDYFRLSSDHCLLFGGRVSYSTLTPANLRAAMRRSMLRVFPQLADVSTTHAWGGFVDISMNRAPDFGRLAPDVLYLQGFSGHGLALSGMAGRLAADAIAGQAERFDLLARIRHRPFPGGDRLRTPALVLGMFYHRLRDLF